MARPADGANIAGVHISTDLISRRTKLAAIRQQEEETRTRRNMRSVAFVRDRPNRVTCAAELPGAEEFLSRGNGERDAW